MPGGHPIAVAARKLVRLGVAAHVPHGAALLALLLLRLLRLADLELATNMTN